MNGDFDIELITDNVLKQLSKTINSTKMLRVPIKDEIQKSIKRNFYKFPDGVWAPWTEATLETKQRKKLPLVGLGGGQAILQESYRLYMGSVMTPIVKFTGDTITYSIGNIGEPKERAKWMQFGAGTFANSWSYGEPINSSMPRKPGRGNIKPRPFFGILKKDIQNILITMNNFIITKVKRTVHKTTINL